MGKFKKKDTPSSSKPKSRKEIRKEKRMIKKKRRSGQLRMERRKQLKIEQGEQLKKVPDKSVVKKEASRKIVDTSHNKLLQQQKKDEKAFKKLKSQMRKNRKRQLMADNNDEDKFIRDLEKKLKLNRRKSTSIPKSFVSEGLDYLLEICNYDKFKDAMNLEKELHGAGDEFEDDFVLATGSKKNEKKTSNERDSDEERVDRELSSNELDNDSSASEEEQDSNDDDNNSSEGDNFENDHPNVNNDDSSPVGSENDVSEGDEDEFHSEAEDESGSETQPLSKRKKLKEDIYGRLRDEKGNVVELPTTKYVPPHLRGQSTSETNENLMRLAKQMKGFLNRLTERNMHSIATQVEELYMKHSRHDVNSTLLKLLMDSLISPVLSPERIVIEHAMLLTILHANVGSEIGANIIEHLVNEFVKLFQENLSVEDKRLDNIVLLLCHLYNFKVFHGCLLYDILDKFAEKFDEKTIELMLVVLKNVGFTLRKDDPIALKDFIQKVQKQANESTSLCESARVRFMLDTLTAIKNNNMLKVPDYDPSYVDHLKKIQKSLIRQGKYVTELKISLEDLLNADTKGKWWVVGSAWSGVKTDKSTTAASQTFSFDDKILELAKKHMNTDTRRNIFCVLMSAETYTDACERLLRLGLRGRQYREIFPVLLHCLLREKQYNPYYAFVAEHFCSMDRKYQLALQYSVRDKLEEKDSLKKKQIPNLAKFLSYLFVEQKLPLSILKVLQFTEMNEQMVRLIRQILLAILLYDDETVVVETFSRISKSEDLLLLRDGLQFFLQHFMLKNVEKSALEEKSEKGKLLPERVELAVNAMRSSSS